MKQKLSLAGLFLVFTVLGFTVGKAQKYKQKESLLWEISGNDLKKPSYLFGTIHIIPKADYIFTKKMEKAFNSCSTLALEVDMDMSLSEQVKLAQRAMLPGTTLKDYMTEDEFNRFSAYVLDSLKIKKSKYNAMLKMKPFFGSSLMIEDLIDNPEMYEQNLSKMAKKNKMEIVGLETIDYQMSVIEKISIEEQVRMLLSDDLSGNPMDEYQVMVEAYKAQDIEELHNLTNEESLGEETEYALLTQRNLNWIPNIKDLINQNPTFIAVGAGHLPGETGIIELLKKEGYNVKPIH